MKVNGNETKVEAFKKAGILPRRLNFTYNGEIVETVDKFSYLGTVFFSQGEFLTLLGQSKKVMFKLNTYLFSFTNLRVKTLKFWFKIIESEEK